MKNKKLLSKRLLLAAVFIISIINSVYAQRIIRNEADKFTKVHVIETSREVLKSQFRRMLRQAFVSYNGKVYLKLTLTYHSAFRVDEGNVMYLLLEDQTSIPIKCTLGGIADYNYDGVSHTTFWYGTFNYYIPENIIPELLEKRIIAVRVGLNGNEYDVWDNIKAKNANKFQKMLQMVSK